MIRTWSDLSYKRRRIVCKLTDKDEFEEKVGRQLDEIRVDFHSAVGSLQALGFVDVTVGWHGSVWVTLTDRGRRIRDAGQIT